MVQNFVQSFSFQYFKELVELPASYAGHEKQTEY